MFRTITDYIRHTHKAAGSLERTFDPGVSAICGASCTICSLARLVIYLENKHTHTPDPLTQTYSHTHQARTWGILQRGGGVTSKNSSCFVTNWPTCTHINGTKLYRLEQKYIFIGVWNI